MDAPERERASERDSWPSLAIYDDIDEYLTIHGVRVMHSKTRCGSCITITEKGPGRVMYEPDVEPYTSCGASALVRGVLHSRSQYGRDIFAQPRRHSTHIYLALDRCKFD